jgi:hypothetical protein
MSTAGISSSSLVQGAEYFQDRKSDLQQLGQALQAGNLAGAQQDFATIQNLGQNGRFANGNAFAVNARQQDFNAIGQALQSGDLAGAQTALTQLQSTFQSGGATGPVLDPGPAVIINISASAASTTGTAGATAPTTTAPATTTPVTNTTDPATTASGPEIILNLGNGNGTGNGPEEITISLNNTSAGEQLTIGVGTEQNPNAQQLTFNLAQNTNEQIILNFGAVTAGSSTSGTSSAASTAASTAATGTTTGATATPASGLNVLA